jgi:type VI secretion system secreted protein Hcp
MRRLIVATVLLMTFICSSALAGGNFFITITGKTTKFKGESIDPNHKDDLEGLAYSYEVKSPRDLATGQASGKRQHGAITITKEWGAASPQLFNALVKNEQLSTVVFTFMTTDQTTGGQIPYYKVTLTNATIAQIHSFKDLTYQREYSTKELESVSFTFQKIQVESLTGKTTASDNWTK